MTSRPRGISRMNADIVKFLFELGQLKRVKRSGWWLINIKDPETVAEHSYRAAMVGYVLAKMEDADADKVMKMCLLQDICEARLNDLHKLGHRYIEFKEYEAKAFEEQMQRLPKGIQDEFLQLFSEYRNDGSNEGILARDADLLECALQAKEYIDAGFDASTWNENIKRLLKTASAKALFKEIISTSSNSWWQGLKKSER